MIKYIKQNFGEKGNRMNPKYEPPHCFTICKCEICGEWYEADRLHLCKTQNSYPYIEEAEDSTDFFTKGHLHLGYESEEENAES